MIEIVQYRFVCDLCGKMDYIGDEEFNRVRIIGRVGDQLVYKFPNDWIEVLGHVYCDRCKNKVTKKLSQINLLELEGGD